MEGLKTMGVIDGDTFDAGYFGSSISHGPKSRVRFNSSKKGKGGRGSHAISPMLGPETDSEQRSKKNQINSNPLMFKPNSTIPAQWASLTIHPQSCRPSLLSSETMRSQSSLAIRSVSHWLDPDLSASPDIKSEPRSLTIDHDSVEEEEGGWSNLSSTQGAARVHHFLPDMFRNQQARGQYAAARERNDDQLSFGDQSLSPGDYDVSPRIRARTLGYGMSDAEVHAHLRSVTVDRQGRASHKVSLAMPVKSAELSKAGGGGTTRPKKTMGAGRGVSGAAEDSQGDQDENARPHIGRRGGVGVSAYLKEEGHTTKELEDDDGTESKEKDDEAQRKKRIEQHEKDDESERMVSPVVLMRLPMFQALNRDPAARSHEDIRLVAGLLGHSNALYGASDDIMADAACVCRYQEYNQRDVIIREGAVAEDYYIILAGFVKVVAIAGDSIRGDQVDVNSVQEEVNRLGPGEGFGEMALLFDQPRSATVVAFSAAGVCCAVIAKDDYVRLLKGFHTTVNRYHDKFVY